MRLTDFHVCPDVQPDPRPAADRPGGAARTGPRRSPRAGRSCGPACRRCRRCSRRPATGPASSASGTSATSTRTGPIDKGFQESVYHLGWGQLHSTPEFDWPLIDGRYFHNGVEKRYKGHCTDFWFDSAMAWMKERKAKGEPFLCYLPTNAPHAPHIDLDEYVKPYRGQGAGRRSSA